jgi:hypothetical protein
MKTSPTPETNQPGAAARAAARPTEPGATELHAALLERVAEIERSAASTADPFAALVVPMLAGALRGAFRRSDIVRQASRRSQSPGKYVDTVLPILDDYLGVVRRVATLCNLELQRRPNPAGAAKRNSR